MNTKTTRIAKIIGMSDGNSPSVTLENRFTTAAVTFDGKRKEFIKTVSQQVTVHESLYDQLVRDVKVGEQIEATIKTIENTNLLEDYRRVPS